MCITKVESYRYGDKHYNTELEAIDAALESVGCRIVKDHAHNPIKGILEHADKLTPLLIRREALVRTGVAAEVASDESQRGPKGVPVSLVQETYDQAKSAMRVNAFAFIRNSGFSDLTSFLERAPIKKRHALELILELREDEE